MMLGIGGGGRSRPRGAGSTSASAPATRSRILLAGALLAAAPATAPGGTPARAVDVGVGSWSACARFDDGTARCWGEAAHGDGADQPGDPPRLGGAVAVPGAVTALAVHMTSCAVVGGVPWCWDAERSRPAARHLSGVTAIAVGRASGCAVTAGGVQSWAGKAAPRLVRGPVAPIRAIDAGDEHSCAVDGSGAVWCWGENGFGELGDGTIEPRATPIRVSALDGIVATDVAAGGHHTCVLASDGRVRCWGWGQDGQLGQGRASDSRLPLDVTGLEGTRAVAIAAGYLTTCALLDDGGVRCFGDDPGDGTAGATSAVVVPLGRPARAIDVGRDSACAALDDGSVWCWGSHVPAVGLSSRPASPTPSRVVGL